MSRNPCLHPQTLNLQQCYCSKKNLNSIQIEDFPAFNGNIAVQLKLQRHACNITFLNLMFQNWKCNHILNPTDETDHADKT